MAKFISACCACLPFAFQYNVDYSTIGAVNIHLYVVASEHLWYHVECEVVACVAHNSNIRVLAGAYAYIGKGRCTTSVGRVVPGCTCAVEVFRKRVLALHYGVAYLDLIDGLVPRKVLTYGKANTCEGVAEVEARSGVNTACGVVHVACAGRHKVLLFLHVGVYFEVYAGAA